MCDNKFIFPYRTIHEWISNILCITLDRNYYRCYYLFSFLSSFLYKWFVSSETDLNRFEGTFYRSCFKSDQTMLRVFKIMDFFFFIYSYISVISQSWLMCCINELDVISVIDTTKRDYRRSFLFPSITILFLLVTIFTWQIFFCISHLCSNPLYFIL